MNKAKNTSKISLKKSYLKLQTGSENRESISLTLLGNPVSVNSLYRNFRGRSILSQRGREIKEDYGWQLRTQYRGEPLKLPVEVDITLYYGDLRKRDIDNPLKVILDALKGIVFEDDSQVVDMYVHKRFDKQSARIEIIVHSAPIAF